MEQEWRASGFDDGSSGHDVVQVGVAGHDSGDTHAHVAGECQDFFGLVARVDHAGFAALPRADDPAVFSKQSDDYAADFQLDSVAAH